MQKVYTLKLNSSEAASLRVMLKRAFQEETSFIEKAKGDLNIFPGAQAFIDVAERERQLYSRVYEALRVSDEDRAIRTELDAVLSQFGTDNQQRFCHTQKQI